MTQLLPKIHPRPSPGVFQSEKYWNNEERWKKINFAIHQFFSPSTKNLFFACKKTLNTSKKRSLALSESEWKHFCSSDSLEN